MFLKNSSIVLFVLTVLFFPHSILAQEHEAKDALAHLKANDDTYVLDTYFYESNEKWGPGYDFVESGDKNWIDIAARISGLVADHSIESSIARALLKAPEKVLSLVNTTPDLSANEICLPVDVMMERDTEEEVQEDFKYMDRLEKILQAVKNPALQKAKKVCLNKISEAREAATQDLNYYKTHP